MKKIIISVMLVVLCVLVSGCSASETQNKQEKTSQTQASQVKDGLPKKLTAEKIGTIDVDHIITAEGGLYYKAENGKFGIMTFDGKNDTGAKYTSCNPRQNYFEVATSENVDVSDASSLNCVGLVDATGKQIVPNEYAAIKIINERYVQVSKVSEKAQNEDEALVFYSSDMFVVAGSPSEDDLLFKGTWYIYDMQAEKLLDGVSGTNKYAINGYGDVVEYVTDDEEQVAMNDKGESLPQDANLFDNGFYTIESDKKGVVYNAHLEELFEYNVDDFKPFATEDEYVLASKYGETTEYAVMNLQGEVLVKGLKDRPIIYGDLIHSDNKIYKFDGDQVVDGEYTIVYMDECFQSVWLLKNESEFAFIDKQGTILYQGKEDHEYSLNSSYFSVEKVVGDEKTQYCFGDKEFSIKGRNVAPWLIEVSSEDDTDEVVYSVSGETLVKGYSDYYYASVPKTAIYVYAKTENGFDVYSLK